MPVEITAIDPDSALISSNIRALLTRRGIPKKSHSKKLKEILNLSLSQTHRKLNGSSNWELAQVRRVAEYFNEPVEQLSRLLVSSEKQPEQNYFQAVFFLENRELPCVILVDGPLHSIRRHDYVAYKNASSDWCVCESVNAVDNVKYFKIRELKLVLKETPKLSVAVLDDDEASADNLVEYLIEFGFHAEAFYDQETLIQITEGSETDGHKIDAYVIDWLINGKTSENLVKAIRSSKNSESPIFLLTGEIATGRVRESDVARIIIDYDVSLHEKPTRLSIITAELSKTLGQ